MMHPVVASSIDLLNQGQVALSKITNTVYRSKEVPDGASIGMHIRHIWEHYHLFFKGISSGVIKYENRERDRSVEKVRTLGMLKLVESATQLKRIGFNEIGKSIELELTINNEAETCSSNLGRELLFLSSHTTHHYAIIKLLAAKQNVQLDSTFGLAPSTARYFFA